MSWTSQTVVSKIYEVVDTTGRLDAQRLEQLREVLKRRPGSEVFEALIGVFCSTGRPETTYLDQEYAGRLLLALRPSVPLDVGAVIERILPTWNLSVHQLPRYFEAEIGRDAVLEILDTLRSQLCSEQEQRANDTFRFWLQGGESR